MDIRAGKFPETISAVVIGVSRCADPNLVKLAAVKGETQRLGDVLVSPNACRIPASQVSCLTALAETTREQILSALRQCAGNAKPDDILFFYFAGHGVEHGDSFALVPSDGVAARPDTLITAADLGQSLAGTPARGIFLALDCCGGAAIYENARALFGIIVDRLEYRILLSSSKQGESSWKIRGRGSPFTVALIEALQGRMPGIGQQGEIYFTSLMAHVTSRVAELLEGEYSGLPPQHPNFDGSYQKDPLLFVNSDIAIGRLVLKTARYSPEYVRRRVSQAVGGLAAALAITVVGYWTWLDQHYFFRLEDNHVTLYLQLPLARDAATALAVQHLSSPDRLRVKARKRQNFRLAGAEPDHDRQSLPRLARGPTGEGPAACQDGVGCKRSHRESGRNVGLLRAAQHPKRRQQGAVRVRHPKRQDRSKRVDRLPGLASDRPGSGGR